MRRGIKGRVSAVGIAFLFPSVVLIIVSMVLPFIWTLMLSFQSWDGFGKAEWIGISNYIDAVKDASIRKALFNSIYYAVVSTVGSVALGLLFATLLLKVSGRKGTIIRLILYSPAMLPIAVVGLMFTFFYNPTMGLINQGLSLIGLETLTRVWLQESSTAMPAIIVAAIWKNAGKNMILCFAAMQAIPKSLYESSQIAGAGFAKQTFKITFPLIMPMILLTTINTLGTQYKSFGLIFTMTQGGPGDLTTTVPIKMVKTAFSFGYFGPAATMGILLTLAVIINILVTKVIMGGETYEY